LTKYRKNYTNKYMSMDDSEIEKRRIDPGIAASTGEELKAIETGHGPYYRELVEDLGRLSVVGQEISSLSEKLEQERANLEFLRMVSGLLPKFVIDPKGSRPRKPRFELDGPLAGYYYRQLQAHTLWNSSRDGGGLRAPARPYYVIGRSLLDNHRSKVSLLLLPATYAKKTSESDAWGMVIPAVVQVNKSDLEIWDKVNAVREGMELNEEERKAVLDTDRAKLILDDKVRFKRIFSEEGTFGCTSLIGYDPGKPSEKVVLKSGSVRGDRYEAVFCPKGIPAQYLIEHQMDAHLSKLASAFRITEQLHRLLSGKPEKVETNIEDLMEQNQALRAALKQTMLSSGTLSEEEINRLIKERFPDLT
jgi:hypothetical protein